MPGTKLISLYSTVFPMKNSSTLSDDTRNSRKFRVLILGFAYIVQVYQSKLKALQNSGHVDVAWLAPTKWKMRTWNRTIPLHRRYHDFLVFPVNVRFLNGVNGGYLYPIMPLLDVMRRFKPDVLHYEQEVFSLSAFQAALLARLLRIPLTVFCWENIEKKLSFYRKWTTNFVLNTAGAIVAGNTEAAMILRTWGYRRAILIMPQIGVDTGLFFRRNQIENQPLLTIGYVGRLVPEKGIELIFEAAKQLLGSGISFRIIICGAGSHEQTLRKYAKQLGVDRQISWLGAIAHDGIPDIMAGMDVVVLPSRTLQGRWKEQFGHVLIEAMAMGIPVIGSNSGAIPEVIGRNDLIFPENSSEALTEILEKLAADRKWKNEVSTFLENRAISEYSDQEIAARLAIMWRDVVDEKRTPYLF